MKLKNKKDLPPWIIVKNDRLAVDKKNKQMWLLRFDMIKYQNGDIKNKPDYKDYYGNKLQNI